MKPTVLVNVKPDMQVVREEIFGPVLVAQRFDEIDEVIAQANDTPYGLSASVWSNDLSTVHRVVPKLRAGTVWVNCHNFVDPSMPFRRLPAVGVWTRARPRGDRALHGTEIRVHVGLMPSEALIHPSTLMLNEC